MAIGGGGGGNSNVSPVIINVDNAEMVGISEWLSPIDEVSLSVSLSEEESTSILIPPLVIVLEFGLDDCSTGDDFPSPVGLEVIVACPVPLLKLI